MRVRISVAALVVVVAAACGKGDKKQGASSRDNATVPAQKSAFPTAKQAKVPALSPVTVESTSAKGLVTMARLLMGTTSVADGVAVALLWKDPNKLLTVAPGTDHSSLIDTLGSMEVMVKAPGEAWRTLKVAEGKDSEAFQPIDPLVVMRFDNRGMRVQGKKRSWQKSKPPLGAPGVYELKLRGSMGLKTAPVTFETGVLKVTLVNASASFRTVAELETVGLPVAQRMFPKTDWGPTLGRNPIEDSAGNRVLRYYLSAPNDDYRTTVVEMVITRGGKILSLDWLRYFTCVAEGTRVDSERGSVPVESLRVGDRVWGYDVDEGARRLTPITSIRRHTTGALVGIGPTLRTTAAHPIYVDGEWVPAGQLGATARVMNRDGRVAELAVKRTKVDSVVYELSVRSPNNFFADGILVHNKSKAEDYRDGKPWKPWVRASEHPDANKANPGP